MKPFIIFMMLCTLTGCAQHNPFPPDVSGKSEVINTPAIMQEVGSV